MAKKGGGRPDMENLQASICGRVPRPRGLNEGHQWGSHIKFGQINTRYWRGTRLPCYGGNGQQGHHIKTNVGCQILDA